MSKILDYDGFRTEAAVLIDKLKQEKTNAQSLTSFVWVETLNNALAIQAELRAAIDGGREPEEITLPDLVDGVTCTLVPVATTTYIYGATMIAEDAE